MTITDQPVGREGRIRRPTAYKQWLEDEGVDTFHGFYVPDLTTMPLGYWKRMGANATFLDLEGTEEWDDSYVCELPPGEATLPQHHLFEAFVYVLQGEGVTSVRNAGDRTEHQFEWHKGSLFALAPNIRYRHFNPSQDEPVRLLVVTSAPLVMNLFHNPDFVWDNDFVFWDRFSGDADHFSGQTTSLPGRIRQSNIISDVGALALEGYPERGASGKNVRLEIGNSTLTAHISEFPVGTYKKAHRHGPGAHVIIVSGAGYSLMWPEGTDPQQFDWQPGSLVVPPGRWFHQHFNAGAGPARYLAIRWNSQLHPLFTRRSGTATSIKDGGDQIEYEDEAPAIRERFERQLAASGMHSAMPVA
jgi:uncharacterized RmlC-like cupin family protein